MPKFIKQMLFDFRLERDYVWFAVGKILQEGRSLRMTNTADTVCLQYGILLQINDAFTKQYLRDSSGYIPFRYFQAPDTNLLLVSKGLWSGMPTWLESVTI